MLLIVQLVVEEYFVGLLPGESFSNAITLDFRLPVFLLSSVRTFYSIFGTYVQYCQRDCNSFPRGFSVMTAPLHHVLCYSLLVGEFKRPFVLLLPVKLFFHVTRFVVRLPVIYLSTLHVSLDTLCQYFERDSSSFARGHFAMTLPLRSD